MRILQQEGNLREETRSAEQARPGLTSPDYAARTSPLAELQQSLSDRAGNVVTQIEQLPGGTSVFSVELSIMARVRVAMDEAHQLLSAPDTGPATVAAETEAIELLLQAQRVNPQSSGSGAGTAPGGGGSGNTEQSAIALLGSGVEANADRQSRVVLQATGARTTELPAEYRRGLDAFFEAMERTGTVQGN